MFAPPGNQARRAGREKIWALDSKGSGNLAAVQSAQRARIDLRIVASRIDAHQGTSIKPVASDGAKRGGIYRDGFGVEPPVAVRVDGKAATIRVSHGLRSKLKCFDMGFGLSVSGPAQEIPSGLTGIWHDAENMDFATCGNPVLAGSESVAKDAANSAVVHFQLLPLIARGAAGWRCCLPYVYDTKLAPTIQSRQRSH